MRPKRNFRLTPRQQNIGMMALLFRQGSHVVHEIQRLLEVRKLELAVQVMALRDRPLRNFLVKIFQVLSLERRNSTAAGDAFLVGKLFGHEITSYEN